MDLSVVVVNWNSREDLLACLASLERQTHRDLEVIVVDNGSGDGSAAAVRERFPRVRLLEARENLGFAEGCNRGIAASRGDWVVTLNNDTVAEPEWAESLARAATRAPGTRGMLQSTLVFFDRPAVVNSTGIVLLRSGHGRDRDEDAPLEARAEEDEIFCPTAGAAAYRRTMLDALRLSTGWFDAGHFCYLEDLDLGWRARLAGWSAGWVRGPVVRHRYQASSSRRGRAWLRKLAITNHYRTLVKNASWEMLATVAPGCARELVEVGRDSGRDGLSLARSALASARALRGEVEAMRKVPRRAVERRWIGRDSGGPLDRGAP